jgi:UDP-N-acetylmuramate--alanine ligase
MDFDLSTIKNVHFIGIGGIGISAMARMMMHEGKTVTGQDMQDSEIIKELKKSGANISIGQSYESIPSDTELIVYTVAIENYDKDLFEKITKDGKTKALSYPQMLGIVTSNKYTVAVSGTHGKTTTTGMIAKILMDAKKDPTVVIGSLLVGYHSNFIAGSNEPGELDGKSGGYFVVEACEYKRSFLNLNPNVLVITNIDEDHLDYYKDIEDIKSAFREMALKVPEGGFVICDPTGPNVADVIKGIKAKVLNYKDFFDPNAKLKIPGIHNKNNAAAAFTVGSVLAISYTQINASLVNFPGTSRRFEYKGRLEDGSWIYDDYAHHPVEVSATLQGFRELYKKSDGWNITIIFQPHLFSRTKSLLKEFGESFKEADRVFVLPIYYAREVDDGSVSSSVLAKEINKEVHKAKAFDSFEDLQDYLDNLEFNDKDIIVTMGAGEAYKIGDNLLKTR